MNSFQRAIVGRVQNDLDPTRQTLTVAILRPRPYPSDPHQPRNPRTGYCSRRRLGRPVQLTQAAWGVATTTQLVATMHPVGSMVVEDKQAGHWWV